MADNPPFISNGSSVHPSDWKGWLVAGGCGLVVGWVLGVGMNASYTHIGWMAGAGVVVGVVSALAARSSPVVVALGGGVIAALTSVLTMTLLLWRSGRWPLRQENADMIDQYGTPEQAVLRITVIALVAVCVPCAVAAAITAFAKRRAT
jgi:hypothetical protein